MFVTKKKTSFQNKTFLQEIFAQSKTYILNYSFTNKKINACICMCVSVRVRAYYFLDFLKRVNPSPLNALNSSESFISLLFVGFILRKNLRVPI